LTARQAGEIRSAGRMGSTCKAAMETRSPAETWRAARRRCTWERTRKNNTIVGLRNENSTNQVVADAGSAYNNWMTGGTMFTGQLTDNGTRNSFLDTFHRSFNGFEWRLVREPDGRHGDESLPVRNRSGQRARIAGSLSERLWIPLDDGVERRGGRRAVLPDSGRAEQRVPGLGGAV